MTDRKLDQQIGNPKTSKDSLNVTGASFPKKSTKDDNEIFNAGANSLTPTAESPGAFEVFRYPAELGDDENPHYLMFFITVRESDISETEKIAEINGESVSFDLSNANSISKSTEAAQGANVGLGITTAIGGIAKAAQGILSGNTASGPFVATQAVLRTGAAVAGGVSLAALSLGRDQVILKNAIALYLSNKPSSSYKAAWMDEELGAPGAVLSGNKITPTLEGLKTALGAVQGAAASYILQTANEQSGIEKQVAGTFQVAAGIAPNPFKAQLFKSMNFRTFSFDYIFLPKNGPEYKVVQNIIKTFKLYMHPKFAAGKFILNYPAEFNIVYYHKEKRNEELFRISNCALTDMSVEYGGTDFTTFKGTEGAPSEIAMKLTFTELELLSRERIEAGF